MLIPHKCYLFLRNDLWGEHFKRFSLFFLCQNRPQVVSTPSLRRSWLEQTYINTFYRCFNTNFTIFFKKCQHFIVYILEVRRDPSISTNSKGALCCLNFAQKLWKSCQNAKFVQTDGQPTKTYLSSLDLSAQVKNRTVVMMLKMNLRQFKILGNLIDWKKNPDIIVAEGVNTYAIFMKFLTADEIKEPLFCIIFITFLIVCFILFIIIIFFLVCFF